MSDIEPLYTTDYAAWANRHVELLRIRRLGELDIAHLQDELKNRGKSERRELETRFLVLIAHLLKWEYQYHALSEPWREVKGETWRHTISEQRKQLAVLLRHSPGLKSVVAYAVLAAYLDAVDLSSKETGCRLSPFHRTVPTQPRRGGMTSIPPAGLERAVSASCRMHFTPKEIAATDRAAHKRFVPRSTVRLFGSLLDDTRRGGDIDLLIEPAMPLSPHDLVKSRNRFIARLYRLLGERQIDVLIVTAGVPDQRPLEASGPVVFDSADGDAWLAILVGRGHKFTYQQAVVSTYCPQ